MFSNHHNCFYVRCGFPHYIFHQTGNEKTGIGEIRRFNASNIHLLGLEKKKHSVNSSHRLGHHQQKQHHSRTASLRTCEPPISPLQLFTPSTSRSSSLVAYISRCQQPFLLTWGQTKSTTSLSPEEYSIHSVSPRFTRSLA